MSAGKANSVAYINCATIDIEYYFSLWAVHRVLFDCVCVDVDRRFIRICELYSCCFSFVMPTSHRRVHTVRSPTKGMTWRERAERKKTPGGMCTRCQNRATTKKISGPSRWKRKTTHNRKLTFRSAVFFSIFSVFVVPHFSSLARVQTSNFQARHQEYQLGSEGFFSLFSFWRVVGATNRSDGMIMGPQSSVGRPSYSSDVFFGAVTAATTITFMDVAGVAVANSLIEYDS